MGFGCLDSRWHLLGEFMTLRRLSGAITRNLLVKTWARGFRKLLGGLGLQSCIPTLFLPTSALDIGCKLVIERLHSAG